MSYIYAYIHAAFHDVMIPFSTQDKINEYAQFLHYTSVDTRVSA